MDEDYYYFVREYLVSANVGIKDIEFSHISIEEYFGSNESDLVEKIRKEMIAENLWIKVVEDRNGRLISVLRKDDVIEVVELLFVHESKGQKISFTLDMESDGTRRLFDLIPILFQARSKETTFFVDEMERSIHPSLIHQLLLKFSQNWKTKGQIILSTHETSLLDQDIFRRDEIWFVEKDKNGSTDLYPLSDFKEHHTKNIRNGYLSGRYGGIPFLGDLEKLNYNQDAITE
ncbi:MAG: ATP-binding protein [Bacteroidota bacterium]